MIRPGRNLLSLRFMRWSIRGRIVLAFLSIGVIIVVLGIFAVEGAGRSERFVRNTYDQTVIATSYARAATADFANMRAGFAYQVMSPNSRREIERQLSAALEGSFQADLATAIEKSSADTQQIGSDLRAAVADWVQASGRLGSKPSGASWDDLESHARRVEDLLETLVSRVSDRGYAYRQEAQATMGRDIELTTAGVVVALAISGFVALMLYLRISAPLSATARFANDIASGTLDGRTPEAGTDEIGDLVRAMVSMRTDIGAMMKEQVVLRERSQARLAEALEGSRDGVIIADAQGIIHIANLRALDFLGVRRDDLAPDTSLETLVRRMVESGDDRSALLIMRGDSPESVETLLPDGRWIQNSRNRTTEGGLVALYADITAIRDQADRLAEANATLDAALGNMSQGLCLFDGEDRLKLANTRFRFLFGLSEHDLPQGTPYRDMVAWALRQGPEPGPDLDRIMRHEAALIRQRHSLTRSVSIGRRIFAVTQERLADGGWIATYEDVTERRRVENQIAFLASHDALTHLPNRAVFSDRVEEAVLRMRRGSGFAVHCINLDHFKQVNDAFGHAIGDQLLRSVAGRLQSCIRQTDVVARLGGDEFAILQSDVSSAALAMQLAQRIQVAVAAPHLLDGQKLLVGVSVGIALCPGDGLSQGYLLKAADAALHKAKEDGRGTWRFFERAMNEKQQLRRALDTDLRRALEQNEFEVHYQPLFDVGSARIGGFEALVRWRHPLRGMIAPDAFIPMAEETGLIREIGRWVLQAACLEATRWPEHRSVAVNVSGIQLQDPGFVQLVTETLAQTGLPADRLELEVTETILMANHERVLPILTGLRAIGVRFAMDDFGTGYSSLSALRAFPFDKIKIDRSFVRDLGLDAAAEQIIRTILALGHSLKMRVTAEGVETAPQMEALTGMGCEEIQGYFIGRPTPADLLPALLAGEVDPPAAITKAA